MSAAKCTNNISLNVQEVRFNVRRVLKLTRPQASDFCLSSCAYTHTHTHTHTYASCSVSYPWLWCKFGVLGFDSRHPVAEMFIVHCTVKVSLFPPRCYQKPNHTAHVLSVHAKILLHEELYIK